MPASSDAEVYHFSVILKSNPLIICFHIKKPKQLYKTSPVSLSPGSLGGLQFEIFLSAIVFYSTILKNSASISAFFLTVWFFSVPLYCKFSLS